MTQLCSVCPRGCDVDRAGGQLGFCAVPDAPMVARAAPHFGEEPCISGTRGSGAGFGQGKVILQKNAAAARSFSPAAACGAYFARTATSAAQNTEKRSPSRSSALFFCACGTKVCTTSTSLPPATTRRRSPRRSRVCPLASRSCGTARAMSAWSRCVCSRGSCRYTCRT